MTMKKAEIAESSAPTTDEGEWTLQIGCHRGTITSRDSTTTNCKFYSRSSERLKSLEDCIRCAKDYANNWQRSGLYVWYAHAFSPAGERFTNLVPSVPYS